MKNRINILIVDDHPIFRRGLRDILKRENKVNIVADVADGIDALNVVKNQKIDIIILDLEMPKMDGFVFMNSIKHQKIDAKIIILTMHKEKELFDRAMELGVKGFVNKENAISDIVECIHAVMNGKVYVCSMFKDLLERKNNGQTTKHSYMADLALLTSTERKVLKLIAENKSSRQIADELFISTKTVENHRTNICSKLNLHGTHALLKFLLEHKSNLL